MIMGVGRLLLALLLLLLSIGFSQKGKAGLLNRGVLSDALPILTQLEYIYFICFFLLSEYIISLQILPPLVVLVFLELENSNISKNPYKITIHTLRQLNIRGFFSLTGHYYKYLHTSREKKKNTF